MNSEPTRSSGIDKLLLTGDHIESYRSKSTAKHLLNAFAAKLGNYAQFAISNEPLSTEYIQEILMNVAWYAKHIKKALANRALYVLLYIALLAGIPAVLLANSNKLADTSNGIPVITQLVVGLTFVVALQQIGNVIFQEHQRYSIWWKTESALKTIWYTTMSTWSDADPRIPGKTEADFLLDLKTSILKARALVAEEQQDFFDTIGKPFPDILGTLTSASSAVTGLVSGMLPGSASANARVSASFTLPIKERRDLEKQQIILDQLDQAIAEVNKKITDPATSSAEKTIFTARLLDLNTAKTTAMTTRISTLADLALATRSYT